MDLRGFQCVFYGERVSFVQARSPVPDRLAVPAVSAAYTTVPSTILVWPGHLGAI